jgi:2,4-dienoyl-CoA reductase-like NADH-dependent reductase (Old Yellow Enzyme family)
MRTPAQTFLAEIEAFLKRSGMSATAFGRNALNDPNFVHDVRDGRLPNLGLVGRVQEYIRSQRVDAA